MGRKSRAKTLVQLAELPRAQGIRVAVDLAPRLVWDLRANPRFAHVFAKVLGRRIINDLTQRPVSARLARRGRPSWWERVRVWMRRRWSASA